MSSDTLSSNANEVIGRLESLLQASLLLRTGLPKNIFASTGTRLEPKKKKKNSGKHLAPSLLILATSALRTATADKLPCQPFSGGKDAYLYLHHPAHRGHSQPSAESGPQRDDPYWQQGARGSGHAVNAKKTTGFRSRHTKGPGH